jgi:hypothetical protein
MKLNPNLILLVVVGLIVGFVFWPTIYRYEKSGSDVIRINRVTGLAQVLGDEGWKDLAPKETIVGRGLFTSNPFFAEDELSKIQGNAGLTGYGYFKGSLYNGTSSQIAQVEFEITAKKFQEVVWTRSYQEDFTDFKPKTSHAVLVAVTGDEAGLDIEWRIISATRGKE